MEENISEENKSASEAIHNDWKSNDLRKVPKIINSIFLNADEMEFF